MFIESFEKLKSDNNLALITLTSYNMFNSLQLLYNMKKLLICIKLSVKQTKKKKKTCLLT